MKGVGLLMFENTRRRNQNHLTMNHGHSRDSRRIAVPLYAFQMHCNSNQFGQWFTDSCPARLPSPGACPFGGACHACPARAQAKLTVSQPNDPYEQEADRVADQVITMPEPQVQRGWPSCGNETLQKKRLAEEITPLVQRQEEPEEEEEEPVQTKREGKNSPRMT